MTYSQETPSAAEMEQRVEHTREDLVRTIEALEQRFSPDYLIDHTVSRIRDSGIPQELSVFGRNLGRGVRDNPMPLLLMGVGVAWMMYASNNRTRSNPHDTWPYDDGVDAMSDGGAAATEDVYGTRPGRQSGSAAEDSGSLGGHLQSGLHKAADAATAAAEKGRSVGSRAAHLSEKASNSMHATTEAVSDKVRHTASSVAAGSRTATAAVGEKARHARDAASNMLHDHPLVIGLLGLAAGAAVSALLPRTRAEDEAVGEFSSAVKRKAVSAAREGAARLEDAASATYEAAKDEAREQGLTPERADEAASDLRKRADKVGQAAASAASRSLSGDGSTPRPPGAKA